jgi:hypothetical protein
MAATVKGKSQKSKEAATPGQAAGYDAFKTFEGKQYTGMKVGRSHKWYYDQGEWKEKKITPDKWEITYSVTKRRAGKAPEGSGVPVGTGYHWFILAHQFVHKLNADDYSTGMVGIKLKLAHRRADHAKWNISEGTKRKHLIRMLKDFIKELEEEPRKFETVALDFEFKDKQYRGFAVPMMESCSEGVCTELDVTLNDKHIGILRHSPKGWRMTNVKPQAFVNTIAAEIEMSYE